MRVAGRLASELLDYLTPHVQPGVTTRRDQRARARLHGRTCSTRFRPRSTTRRRATRPIPASLCTSVNHVVCHGIPGDKKLKAGDIVNIDVTVIKDGYHGDTSRMFHRRHAVDPGQAPVRDHVRGDVARHPRGQARRASRRHRRTIQSTPRATASRSSASSAGTASAGSSTRSRRCCTTGAPAPASSCSRA